MPTLHLTPTEQTLHAALPADVRSDIAVVAERLSFEDSEELLSVRLELMHFSDPAMLDLRKRIQSAASMDDMMAAVDALDFRTVSEHDLIELLFALGPTIVGNLIEEMLHDAKEVDDVRSVATFSAIRHVMLQSLIDAHASPTRS